MRLMIADMRLKKMVEVKDARPVIFRSPKWLGRFRFATSKYDGPFCLTEVSTGAVVPRSYSQTRVGAVRLGKEILVKHGRKKVIEAVGKAKEIIKSWG